MKMALITSISIYSLFFISFLAAHAVLCSPQLQQQQIIDFDSNPDLDAEDSFSFQNQDTFTVSSVQRLWGISDASTHVGKLFHLSVPPDAFSGTIDYFKAEGTEGRPLAKWLIFNQTAGVLEGVPSQEDIGETYIKIVAVNTKLKESVDDVFSIDVLPFNYFDGFQKDKKCEGNQDMTVLNLMVDASLDAITTQRKTSSIKNLAGYLGLHYSMVSLLPVIEDENLMSNSILVAGPGDAVKQKAASSSNFLWQIGCDSRVWLEKMDLLTQVKQDALDGSLSETLQIPVIGWHVSSISNTARKRRETEKLNEENVESNNGPDEPDLRIVPSMSSPVFPHHPMTVEPTLSHPHRHHHGDSLVSMSHVYKSPDPVISIMPTPVFHPDRPTSVLYSPPPYELKSRTFLSEDLIAPSPSYGDQVSTVMPDFSSEVPDVQVSRAVDNSASYGEVSSQSSSFTPSLPITSITTEKTENDTKNFPPTILHRLPKFALTAGKVFRYKIPNDTFSDLEDGNSRQLQLNAKLERLPIPNNSWIQFNSEAQEVYALPVEEQVSKWTLNIEAVDSGGSSVTDNLELQVQHHKKHRAVTHEILLHVRINNPQNFPSAIDWKIFLVEKLALLNNDTDEVSQITVRSANLSADPIIFAYTNDSLPTNQCTTDHLRKLLSVLASDVDTGKVKPRLNEVLSPHLTISKVTWQGIGQCESKPTSESTHTKSENHSPSTRNPVDSINASVGQLYIYKVPEDTFYDEEDGYTPNLKLSLLTMDRTPIPSNNWLQFDSKNQEFYGIPSIHDIGSKEYLLVGEDKTGLAANDGLVVSVKPPLKVVYSVEFSLLLNTPHLLFINSPPLQRHFVQQLSYLFRDADTSNIVINSTLPGSTLITWYNRSLPIETCPSDELMIPLRKILLTDDEKLEKRVNEVMGPEFLVLSAQVTPVGVCLAGMTEGYVPDLIVPVIDDIQPVSASGEYLVTFVIPTVIIIIMLLFSSLVACLLYRRKRTGKMSIGDEDERKSFRSKGIPVIFQDELEEKLEEPSNKSPVIMKEERPPLPPPEYQRTLPLPTTALLSDTEDSPYQPPPPFTTSRGDSDRQSRPKPTPTYRMPPPYVPP